HVTLTSLRLRLVRPSARITLPAHKAAGPHPGVEASCFLSELSRHFPAARLTCSPVDAGALCTAPVRGRRQQDFTCLRRTERRDASEEHVGSITKESRAECVSRSGFSSLACCSGPLLPARR